MTERPRSMSSASTGSRHSGVFQEKFMQSITSNPHSFEMFKMHSMQGLLYPKEICLHVKERAAQLNALSQVLLKCADPRETKSNEEATKGHKISRASIVRTHDVYLCFGQKLADVAQELEAQRNVLQIYINDYTNLKVMLETDFRAQYAEKTAAFAEAKKARAYADRKSEEKETGKHKMMLGLLTKKVEVTEEQLEAAIARAQEAELKAERLETQFFGTLLPQHLSKLQAMNKECYDTFSANIAQMCRILNQVAPAFRTFCDALETLHSPEAYSRDLQEFLASNVEFSRYVDERCLPTGSRPPLDPDAFNNNPDPYIEISSHTEEALRFIRQSYTTWKKLSSGLRKFGSATSKLSTTTVGSDVKLYQKVFRGKVSIKIGHGSLRRSWELVPANCAELGSQIINTSQKVHDLFMALRTSAVDHVNSVYNHDKAVKNERNHVKNIINDSLKAKAYLDELTTKRERGEKRAPTGWGGKIKGFFTRSAGKDITDSDLSAAQNTQNVTARAANECHSNYYERVLPEALKELALINEWCYRQHIEGTVRLVAAVRELVTHCENHVIFVERVPQTLNHDKDFATFLTDFFDDLSGADSSSESTGNSPQDGRLSVGSLHNAEDLIPHTTTSSSSSSSSTSSSSSSSSSSGAARGTPLSDKAMPSLRDILANTKATEIFSKYAEEHGAPHLLPLFFDLEGAATFFANETSPQLLKQRVDYIKAEYLAPSAPRSVGAIATRIVPVYDQLLDKLPQQPKANEFHSAFTPEPDDAFATSQYVPVHALKSTVEQVQSVIVAELESSLFERFSQIDDMKAAVRRELHW